MTAVRWQDRTADGNQIYLILLNAIQKSFLDVSKLSSLA